MPDHVFAPHELKTIEVDVEKNIFQVNGEDFGSKCTGFSIHCNGYRDFEIRMEIDTAVVYSTYGEDQKKACEKSYPLTNSWFKE